MRAIAVTKSRVLLVLAMVAAGLMLGGSAASAATGVDRPLRGARQRHADRRVSRCRSGASAYRRRPGDCATATASLPGPQLAVTLSATETTTVTFNVTNALPAGHTISFEIPGITFDAGADRRRSRRHADSVVHRAVSPSAPGRPTRAGTYLYQSGGDGGRQEAMGLYGALIVRPSTANQAYESATTAYDVEAPLVLSAVDPAFNWRRRPDGLRHVHLSGDLLADQRQGLPGHAPGITATAGQRVLLRYVNAGLRQHDDGAARHARARRRQGRPAAQQPVRRQRRDHPRGRHRGRDRHRPGRCRRRAPTASRCTTASCISPTARRRARAPRR